MASCILTAPGLSVVRRWPCTSALAPIGSVKGEVSHSLNSLKGGGYRGLHRGAEP